MFAIGQRNQHVERQANVAGPCYAPPLTPLSAAVPAPPPHFTGRATDLAALAQQLTAGRTVAVTALQGMGGIGKTALASQLATQLAPHFSGGVFWGSLVDHDGRAQPILRIWGRTCAHDLAEQQDPAALANLVRDLLVARQAEQGPLLVIVDDVRPAWLDGAHLIKHAIPAGAPLLFTTCEQGLAATLGAASHRLDALAPGEARSLLDSLVGDGVTAGDPDAARLLLDALGYLPLGIELAAARLKQLLPRPGFQLRGFSDAIIQRSQNTLKLPGHPGLAGAFAITYDALRAEQQQLFRQLGSFAPESLALVHVAGLLEQEPAAVEQRLDDLVSVAYLGYDRARPGYYTLHPLLRNYASQLLAEAGEREAADHRHVAYFLAFAEANQEVDPAAWDRLESALPDLLLAVEVAVQRRLLAAPRTFGGALVGNSEFLYTRGYNQAAREVLGHMLAACRALEDVEGAAAALGNLGVLAREQGDYAAAHAYHGQALALHKGLDNLLGQATALTNLGAVATDQGDYSGARSYLHQALELDTVLRNPLGQAQDLCNLGVVAIHQGDYATARFYLQRSAALYRQLGLAVHPAVVRGLERVSEHSPWRWARILAPIPAMNKANHFFTHATPPSASTAV